MYKNLKSKGEVVPLPVMPAQCESACRKKCRKNQLISAGRDNRQELNSTCLLNLAVSWKMMILVCGEFLLKANENQASGMAIGYPDVTCFVKF